MSSMHFRLSRILHLKIVIHAAFDIAISSNCRLSFCNLHSAQHRFDRLRSRVSIFLQNAFASKQFSRFLRSFNISHDSNASASSTLSSKKISRLNILFLKWFIIDENLDLSFSLSSESSSMSIFENRNSFENSNRLADLFFLDSFLSISSIKMISTTKFSSDCVICSKNHRYQ